MSSVHNTYAQLIRTERERQGLSYRKLSEMSGCTYTSIWRWEHGEDPPSLENADALLRALGVSMTIGEKRQQ